MAATPAQILNIGTGATQNHFAVQIAPTGGSTYETHDQAEIAAGYTDPNHFFVTADGWVGFKPRADGPTTSGTTYARDELRELNADGSNAKWDALAGEHILQGRTRIIHTPANDPDVVIAQLHNGDADRIAIRTQMLSTGTVVLGVRVNGSLHATRMQNPWVSGSEFDWKIRLINGACEIYYNDMVTPLITVPAGTLVQTTDPAGWYWKTGAYNQFEPTATGATGLSVSSTEYSEVHLKSLSVQHGSVVTSTLNKGDFGPSTVTASSGGFTGTAPAVVAKAGSFGPSTVTASSGGFVGSSPARGSFTSSTTTVSSGGFTGVATGSSWRPITPVVWTGNSWVPVAISTS